VVKSEGICNLRRNVGMSAVSDNSRLAFLDSFRIEFRENNFLCCYILFLIFQILFPSLQQ